jgi:hypothetical protein
MGQEVVCLCELPVHALDQGRLPALQEEKRDACASRKDKIQEQVIRAARVLTAPKVDRS